MESKFKRVFHDQLSFVHDLFKAELSTMKKNVSFSAGSPQIEEVEHVHFYHSHDSSGTPQKYTSAIGGHFHEIIHTVIDKKTGETKASCGPALRHTYKKFKNGKGKKVVDSIQYHNEENDTYIKDNHTHELTYMRSEEISSATKKARVASDQRLLKTLMPEGTTSETTE